MSRTLNQAAVGLCIATLGLAVLPDGDVMGQEANDPAGERLETVLAQVDQYCGICHKVPPPTVMPKASWPNAVRIMADMANERYGPAFVSEDTVRDITAYYYGSSPEQLPALPYFDEPSEELVFGASRLGEPSGLPLIVNVHAVEPEAGQDVELLVCDGGRNEVLSLTRSDDRWHETVLAEVEFPSHTEVVDYDGDGDRDIIVAALGRVTPTNQRAGKVMLLRQTRPGQYEKEILLQNMGRITDARPADFDDDGDMDVAVAVFGDGRVGEVSWLENLGDGRHQKHVLVDASGALNVSLVDLNDDGRMDIVSLIAQEYEMVMALISIGPGQFQRLPLASAPHPMYGFTGMNVVDLDRDGDVDFLLTNGDAQDLNTDPKPYHGVQWMENLGEYRFQFHDIGRFYGAANAVAGDLDGDGDLDVAASSWDNFWEDERRQSLIWFENDGAQNFTRHNIVNRPQSIVTLQLLNLVGDGKPDIVAGVFRMDRVIDQLRNPDGADEPPQSDTTDHSLADARILVLENRLAR